MKRIVHISDLHLGRNRETDDSAARLAWELLSSSIDCVVVTGNLTHNGKRDEWTLFRDLFARLLDEEYDKLLRAASKDVHDDSKVTTLPIAREIVNTYVLEQYAYRHGERRSGDVAQRHSVVGHDELGVELLPLGTLQHGALIRNRGDAPLDAR